MKPILGRIIALNAIFWCIGGFFGFAFAQDSKNGPTGVLVASLLNDIRDTLIRVRTDVEGDLQLKYAKLNLSTVYTVGASGKLELWVVSLGGGAATSTSQSLNMTLHPPAAGDDIPVSETLDALAVAIVEAYEAVRSAELSDPPLRLGQLEAAIRFVVDVEGSGGLRFTILPITAELTGKISSSNVHEIALIFCHGTCSD